jgi:hypothetical protein
MLNSRNELFKTSDGSILVKLDMTAILEFQHFNRFCYVNVKCNKEYSITKIFVAFEEHCITDFTSHFRLFIRCSLGNR